jgi:CDP-diacylglycerol--glycerol-3-phosphate 3-phosphatidyltransferase
MANLITLARLPLLLIIVLLVSADAPAARLVAAVLLPLLIAMDSLDGIVARRRQEVSLLGSVLDIMVDRSVELVLWVCFAFFRLIPLAIPIIYVLRGTVVDSLRSMHVSAGQAPFKGMRTRLGKWLVGSPVMRSSYGAVKLLSFTGLAVAHALRAYAERSSVGWPAAQTTLLVFNITSWVAVVLCLVRGIPVIVEAALFFRRSS